MYKGHMNSLRLMRCMTLYPILHHLDTLYLDLDIVLHAIGGHLEFLVLMCPTTSKYTSAVWGITRYSSITINDRTFRLTSPYTHALIGNYNLYVQASIEAAAIKAAQNYIVFTLLYLSFTYFRAVRPGNETSVSVLHDGAKFMWKRASEVVA